MQRSRFLRRAARRHGRDDGAVPKRAEARRPGASPSRPVLVLHDAAAGGGDVDARDVLVEARHVADALRAVGHAPAIEAVGLDLEAVERMLERHAPAVVFNLAESLDGHAELIHVVPALLEALGTPFTGCPAAAQHLTSNKVLAKRRMIDAGVPTPEEWRPGVGDGPWIVKSVWEHASVGLDDDSVVATDAEAAAGIEGRRDELGGAWFAERFVVGRELNVALLASPRGVEALPVAEIEFEGFPDAKPRIVGYAAKWHADSFEYRATVRRFGVEPELEARVVDIALACWRLFGLEGYARVDFRVDGAGRPFVLDVNANPCLSPDAGFAAALVAAGIGYEEAVGRIADDAFRRGDVAGARAPASRARGARRAVRRA